MRKISILALTLTLLALTTPAFAQTLLLEIKGTVFYLNGPHVEDGFSVTVHNLNKNTQASTTTDGDGRYETSFFNILAPVADPGDTILVTANKDGKSGSETDTYVAGNSMTIDVTLDVPLPTVLGRTSTIYDSDGKLIVVWETLSELGNAGFNIYRADLWEWDQGLVEVERNPYFNFSSVPIKLNGKLIPGAGNSGATWEYRFSDQDAVEGTQYVYLIESVDYQGRTERYPPIMATAWNPPLSRVNKLTTTWGAFKRRLR